MSNNSQSRKWHMVINNPLEHGMSHESIIRLLMLFSPEYFCLSDEISSTETFHTHGFIYSPAPIRFNTLKTRFPVAHIEKAYGSVLDNKNYILKTGKWADAHFPLFIAQAVYKVRRLAPGRMALRWCRASRQVGIKAPKVRERR